MDKHVEQALRASIEKWKANAEAEYSSDYLISPSSCPLCRLFHGTYIDDYHHCIGCPVYENTGETDCEGTPYADAAKKLRLWHRSGDTKYMEAVRSAALEEVAYLESLLPSEGTT